MTGNYSALTGAGRAVAELIMEETDGQQGTEEKAAGGVH